MTVASNQLGSSHLSGTTLVSLYTCPSGKRTIVKSLVVRNTDSSARLIAFEIDNGATTKSSFAANLAASGSSGETAYIQPWIVLVAGDVLKCQMSGGSGYVIASGAELTL